MSKIDVQFAINVLCMHTSIRIDENIVTYISKKYIRKFERSFVFCLNIYSKVLSKVRGNTLLVKTSL